MTTLTKEQQLAESPPHRIRYRFEPQGDITVYELAQMVSKLFKKPLTVEEFNELPPDLKRHYDPYVSVRKKLS